MTDYSLAEYDPVDNPFGVLKPTFGELSPERIGKVTASGVKKVIAKSKTKGEGSSVRRKYMMQLLIENLTGVLAPTYTNAAMKWGSDNEALARAVFEVVEGRDVEPAGFIPHPTLPRSGASPDGLVQVKTVLEIKCPESETHWDWREAGALPAEHKPQVMWQLACTDADVAAFVSFDPRFPDPLNYFCIYVERDDKYIAMLEEEVQRFLVELEVLIAKAKHETNGG